MLVFKGTLSHVLILVMWPEWMHENGTNDIQNKINIF